MAGGVGKNMQAFAEKHINPTGMPSNVQPRHLSKTIARPKMNRLEAPDSARQNSNDANARRQRALSDFRKQASAMSPRSLSSFA